ncbi:MAG: tripartite tricarboxylate transporter substrate binding protein [Pseudomonadota bacterium]
MNYGNTLKQIAITCVVAAALVPAGDAQAQTTNFPTRAIRIIAPFPAGGGYDFMARNIGQRLSEAWGQPALIENRSGANGNIGSDAVAKAPPDGYTLLLGGIGPQALSVPLYLKLPYDPLKDFEAVSLVAAQPNLLVVHPSLPVKNVKELIALAKAKPGEVTFGSPSNGSGQHFGLEQLKIMTGVSMVHVPYKGAAPLHSALLSGEVSVGFNIIQLPLPYVKTGRLRALATASTKRAALAPDIPTMAELGYPIDFDTWYGLYAPAGTPKDVVAKISAEVMRILALQEFKDRAAVLGVELLGTPPDRLSAHMRNEITRWTKVARAANIKVE